jgi:hypothetical protein
MDGARLRQGSQEKYLPSAEGRELRRADFVVRCRRRVLSLRQSAQMVNTAYEKLRQVARDLRKEGWARSLSGATVNYQQSWAVESAVIEREILRMWLLQ